MTSREKFEAWFKSEIIEREDFVFNAFDDDTNEYTVCDPDESEFYEHVQAMYMAWQASRDEEIELPPRQEPTSSGHYGEGYLVASSAGSSLDYEDTVDAIRAAGFKVKGG